MDSTDLIELLDALDDKVDELQEALGPMLKTPLAETAGKLPLLDKAQLYVLTTYAIECTLFSYLRLHGVKAKEHPVFQELTRVKQYFEKIKAAESSSSKPNTQLDKAAAGRFIKHALVGNEKYDRSEALRLSNIKPESQGREDQVSNKGDLAQKYVPLSRGKRRLSGTFVNQEFDRKVKNERKKQKLAVS
ncbi:MAG: hypothetical protein Q9164_001134 [Protoblastenia rupestris]